MVVLDTDHLSLYQRGDAQKDLLIGAIALANDATLLTRNYQHFQRLPGLKIEDWTVQ